MTDEKKKNNSKVVNPHDKVFRETYSNKENGRSLLTSKLPDKVLALMDLDSLEISKDSFIEKELADYYSDILYRVNLTDGSQGLVIELGITLKFPGDIDTVMAKVNKIYDLDALKEIKETIKTAKDISEILALLK